ncbi:alpha/beta hydrolase fold-3 domain-containing protein [Hypoxylon sp. FL1284]|nr:alpha/beta hydrolase fold-3 domain-containing protein [Hypoxylon sp. FL1284]
MGRENTTHPLLSHQPLKLLFQAGYVGAAILSLPFWVVTALIRPLRPRPAWTAKQSFMTRVAYVLLDIECRIAITRPLSLEGGKEGDRFQTVKPQSPDRYRGPLECDSVQPAVVGGTWFPRAPGADIASKLVVLYIHGGAFIRGDGRTDDAGFAARSWIERGGADAVFSLQYRLSGHGGLHPFPAALQDALTAYLHLVEDLRVPARQVVVCGDSSGGNLAVALLRYLGAHGGALGIASPRCAALASPWVAPHAHDSLATGAVWPADFFPLSFLRWGAAAYSAGLPESDPYVTPLHNPFPAPAPIFVNAGADELFAPDIARWAEEMKGVEGNVVELDLEEDACHDTLLLGEILCFEESGRSIAARMGEFVRRC